MAHQKIMYIHKNVYAKCLIYKSILFEIEQGFTAFPVHSALNYKLWKYGDVQHSSRSCSHGFYSQMQKTDIE